MNYQTARPGYDGWQFSVTETDEAFLIALQGPAGAWVWLGTVEQIRQGISNGQTLAKLTGSADYEELYMLPAGTTAGDLAAVVFDAPAVTVELEGQALTVCMCDRGETETTVYTLPAAFALDVLALLTGSGSPYLAVQQEHGEILPACPQCGAAEFDRTHANAATCLACGAVALAEG